MGNVIRHTLADGGQITTHYSYDYINLLGQRVKVTHAIDQLGRSTFTVHDALERAISTNRSETPFGTIVQSYEIYYDAVGNECRRVEKNTVTNQNVETRWTYNSVNQVTSIQEDKAAKLTKYFYNAFGQLEQVVKPSKAAIKYEYDFLNRHSRFYGEDASFDYVYSYDPLDNIITVEDRISDTFTHRSYDLNSLLTSETLGNGLELSYCHDRLGRITQVKLPDGSKICYSYRGALLKQVSRISANEDTLYTHAQTDYDLSGKLLKAQLIGNAGEISYHYDLMQRPIEIRSNHWAEWERTYDLGGQLVSRRIEDSDGVVACSYEYDHLYQLCSESGVADNTYRYDSVYNRIAKNSHVYVVNTINQLIDDGEARYSYHVNGSLRAKKDTQQEICYSYDLNDRLVSITNGNSLTTYTYDAFNRRLNKQQFCRVGQEWQRRDVESYFYLHLLEIGCCHQKDTVTALKVMAIDQQCQKGRIVAIERMGQAYAAIQDACGSVVALVDRTTGITKQNYRYSAFGEEQPRSGKALSPWRLAGHHADEESGLVYFGERYYDPYTGRWITPDPLGFKDGPNLYAYVSNSPLIWRDYMGLFADSQDASMHWHSIGAEIEIVKQAGFFQSMVAAGLEAFKDPGLAGAELGGHLISLGYSIGNSQSTKLGTSSTAGWFNEDKCGRLVGLTVSYSIQGWMLLRGASIAGPIGIVAGKEAWRCGASAFRASWSWLKNSSEVIPVGESNGTRSAESIVKPPAPEGQAAANAVGQRTPLGSELKRFKGDPEAVGAHTQFRVNQKGGVKYATFELETNPQCPNVWRCTKRFDNSLEPGKGHHNSKLDQYIPEPHVHEKNYPGGVRPALPNEIPKFVEAKK